MGQFLSARVDILPEYVTAELANLQDEVAPESYESMQAVVEAEFVRPIGELFEWFDHRPLASASLGQVHRARLPDGESIVIKVQRPEIDRLVRVDLEALGVVIGWLGHFRSITRRADLESLLAEFSRTLWEELDYLAEADNARRFAEIFSADPGVHIPYVYEEYSTSRVLALEDVYFIKITDYAAIESAGIDRGEIAERLLQTYLRQIFDEAFFHADPHPGNLFVEPLEGGGWRLVFVDFGMVGQLSVPTRRGLRDLAVAVGTRDPDRLVRSYQSLGVLLPGADLQRVRQVEAELFERFWGKSMDELTQIHPREMRQFARRFRDVLYEMPFQVPSDLIFPGRCVAILSGICTGLDPKFNVFEHLVPFAQKLLSEERIDWLDTILEWLIEQGGALTTLPGRLNSTLARIERGELTVTASAAPDLKLDIRGLTRAVNRLVAAVAFAALLLVGALLYTNGDRLLGGIGLGLALLALLWTVKR